MRFRVFTLICLITNTEPKISVFVLSHCSGFAKLIVGYYAYCSVLKNLRFCALTLNAFSKYPLLIPFSNFENLRFLLLFCADQCEDFHKNGGLSLRFCTKTEHCERGLKSSPLTIPVRYFPALALAYNAVIPISGFYRMFIFRFPEKDVLLYISYIYIFIFHLFREGCPSTEVVFQGALKLKTNYNIQLECQKIRTHNIKNLFTTI